MFLSQDRSLLYGQKGFTYSDQRKRRGVLVWQSSSKPGWKWKKTGPTRSPLKWVSSELWNVSYWLKKLNTVERANQSLNRAVCPSSSLQHLPAMPRESSPALGLVLHHRLPVVVRKALDCQKSWILILTLQLINWLASAKSFTSLRLILLTWNKNTILIWYCIRYQSHRTICIYVRYKQNKLQPTQCVEISLLPPKTLSHMLR